jgi:hypothetical protein
MTTEPSRRSANVVQVRQLSREDGWACRCLCGWTSSRLHLGDEAQAQSAAAMHTRICRMLQH